MNIKALLSVVLPALPAVMIVNVLPLPTLISIPPSAAQTCSKFQTFVVPNEFSISYPACWFVDHTSNPPNTIPRELAIVTSKKPPEVGGEEFPADLVKTDIQINPGSFETNLNQLNQVTQQEDSKVTRIGRTVVGGRDAFRMWTSDPEANSIVTIVRYTNDETISIVSYYTDKNPSAISIIQRMHGSFRSKR